MPLLVELSVVVCVFSAREVDNDTDSDTDCCIVQECVCDGVLVFVMLNDSEFDRDKDVGCDSTSETDRVSDTDFERDALVDDVSVGPDTDRC